MMAKRQRGNKRWEEREGGREKRGERESLDLKIKIKNYRVIRVKIYI